MVPFYPLDDEVMQKIVRLKLGKISRRVQENYRELDLYRRPGERGDACAAPKWTTDMKCFNYILNADLLRQMSAEF